MKNQILTIFFIFNSLVGISQNEANNWYFGENAGLNFNSGAAQVLLNGQLNTGEGCASISDNEGNLLFYTDGVTVYNKMHEVMLNGNNLNGDFSSTHSAIIVPKPNATNIYFIFTTDDIGGENGLQYSEVNMSLDSDLGGITETKNISLFSPVTEKLTAVKHATLNEYWVVSHKFGNNQFITYRISENGVDINPIISSIGFNVNTDDNSAGQIKISPNGKKIAVARSGMTVVQLFDFNDNTGEISNLINISTSENSDRPAYGIEFSSDSRILYVSNIFAGIYQFDISNEANIASSQFLISSIDNLRYGALQLAVDGKIYASEWESSYLHVINEPNNLGINCDYEYQSLFLGNRQAKFGLPPFIQSFFLINFEVENMCEGDTTQFTANISEPFTEILWDFGDGNTSTNENPFHIFNNAGHYEVILTVTSGEESFIQSQVVTIDNKPITNSLVELKQCDDDLDGFSSFNLNETISEITNISNNETITFYESLSNAENKTNPIFNTINYINELVSSDIVWARVENSNGCFSTSQVNLLVTTTQIPNTFVRNLYTCDDGINKTDGIASFDLTEVSDEIELLFPTTQQILINFYLTEEDALSESNPIPDISNYQNISSPNTQGIFIRVDSALNNNCLGLGQYVNLFVERIPQLDSMPIAASICKGSFIELTALEGYDSYLWSTGELTRTIIVTEPGNYTVTVSNNYNNLICNTSKTIIVTMSEIAIISRIETLDWTQNNNIISVFIEGAGDYEYSINGSIYQDSSMFTDLNIDDYTVHVRDKNGCGIVYENVYLIYYPKFFTPNGDGRNEEWQIINAKKERLNKLYIYDRYGKLLAKLKPNDLGWDGTYNGSEMPSNDYWFVLERENGKTYKGHFSLKR